MASEPGGAPVTISAACIDRRAAVAGAETQEREGDAPDGAWKSSEADGRSKGGVSHFRRASCAASCCSWRVLGAGHC